jgi:sugar lactone lactonase YvrE
MALEKRESRAERRALAPPFEGMFVWDIRCQVGESPVWDAWSGRLLWIDVRGQALFRLDPVSQRLEHWALGQVVGAVGLIDRNTALVALERQLAVVDLSGNVLNLLDEIRQEPQFNRLNEGKFSPSGAWFVFGSMDDRPGAKCATGSLYRADKAGQVTRLYTGLRIANGIAWSSDRVRIYFSDSYAGQVFQAAWDEPTGTLSKPSLYVCSDNANGRPDGALVGAGGMYLSAGVSAGCLNQFDPAGHRVKKVALPLQAPTMPCIGGADLSRLFVTSLMRPGVEAWENDGCLLDMALAMV